MRIMVLYSNLRNDAEFRKRVEAYMAEEPDHEYCFHDIHDKTVAFCNGCWSCWWATPGLCIHRDDMEELYNDILSSDLLVFCAYLEKGFVSWEMKRVMDRLIPLIHPYFVVKNGEIHHRKRYRKYPDIAAILGGGSGSGNADTADDQDLAASFFERFSRNFHGNLLFVRKTGLTGARETITASSSPGNNSNVSDSGKLLINGSPRGTKSNSRVILDAVQLGIRSNGDAWETIDLAQTSKHDEFLRKFALANDVIMAFPLYTDGTPGIVQHFFHLLPVSEKKKTVSFIVQSGFPEETHLLVIAGYLEKLCEKMGWTHGGTVMRGGMEGIRMMPPSWNKKLFGLLEDLGRTYNSGFSPGVVEKLRGKRRLSGAEQLVLRILAGLGLMNFYWNIRLMQNRSFRRRFNAPYPVTRRIS